MWLHNMSKKSHMCFESDSSDETIFAKQIFYCFTLPLVLDCCRPHTETWGCPSALAQRTPKRVPSLALCQTTALLEDPVSTVCGAQRHPLQVLTTFINHHLLKHHIHLSYDYCILKKKVLNSLLKTLQISQTLSWIV